MKLQALLIVISLSISFLFVSCESATETQATTVTRPVLKEPADNSTGISVTPTFKWTNTGNKIEIDANSSFAAPLYSKDDINGSELTWSWPNQLEPNKDYYWRVGVSSGGTMYWSENIFHFKTAGN